MKDEKGFTLIEVLASLVIISIVLMSFMAIFSNTNALAVSNSEKLVVINLADAHLERVKVDPKGTLNFTDESKNLIEELGMTSCAMQDPKPDIIQQCKNKEIIIDDINNKSYKVLFKFSQTLDRNSSDTRINTEKDISLLNVVVTVTAVQSNISSSVEGYIPYE